MTQQRRAPQRRAFNTNRLFVLNEPQTPRISPALAAEIGLNESIIFLQLEFWIATNPVEIEGRQWVRLSLADIQRFFPFWSASTISRTLEKMEAAKLIFRGNFNAENTDTTGWIAFNPEGASQLKSVQFIEAQDDAPVLQNENPVLQNATDPLQNAKPLYSSAGAFKNNKSLRERDTRETENQSTEPLQAAVLDAIGATLRFETGNFSPLERAKLKTFVQYLIASNRTPADVAEFTRRLPAYFKTENPRTPMLETVVKIFDSVMSMDLNAAPTSTHNLSPVQSRPAFKTAAEKRAENYAAINAMIQADAVAGGLIPGGQR